MNTNAFSALGLDLGLGTKEVREALEAVECEAKEAIAAPPASDESVPHNAGEGGAPAQLNLACICCGRQPSDMDDSRETHPDCQKCSQEGRPTVYFCGTDCCSHPGAWDQHTAFHQEERTQKRKVEGLPSIKLMEARALGGRGLPVAAGLAPELDDEYRFQLTVDRESQLLELRARLSRGGALWHDLAMPFECCVWDHPSTALTNVFTLLYHDDVGVAMTITIEETADRDPSVYSYVRGACAAAPLPAGEAVVEEAPQKQGGVDVPQPAEML